MKKSRIMKYCFRLKKHKKLVNSLDYQGFFLQYSNLAVQMCTGGAHMRVWWVREGTMMTKVAQGMERSQWIKLKNQQVHHYRYGLKQ